MDHLRAITDSPPSTAQVAMRRIVVSTVAIILGLCDPTTAFAQTVSLHGVIIDSIARSGIPSASVMLQRVSESAQLFRTASAPSGEFSFPYVPPGQYRLTITHIAYDTLTRILSIDTDPFDAGTLRMKDKTIPQRAVTIMGTPPPVEQIGDTTQFYAGAFAVNKDANAEDLITKMPGVTVEGTTVKSQGEDIKRVLVDGKQFFSDDPMIALRNLPAEIIERVQVYDKLSDQAELTGFDDGQSVRTMNLITRMDRRNGTFGKAFAGYGTDDRYAGGVSAHRFNNEQRLSLFALSNSTNQQNFTMQDILGVMGNTTRGRGNFGGGGGGRGGGGRPGGGGERGGGMMPDGAMMQRMGGAMNDFMVGEQNGLNTTHSIGATFRDEWSKSIDINGNYFVNRSRNQSAQTLEREYIATSDTVQTYDESNSAESRNTNHRFQFRMEWEIDSSNSVIISPRMTAQLHDASNVTFGESGLNTGLVLNTSDVRNTSATTGYNGSVDITYRHRSDRPGRTISLQANLGGSDRDGETTLDAASQYPGSIVAGETLRQAGSSRSKSLNYGSSLVYTEPLDVGHLLQWNYRFSRSESNASKVTTAFDTLTGTYSTIMSVLSSDLDNANTRHSLGTGYRYNATGINGTFSLDYQYSRLAADLRLPRRSVVDKTYWSFLPSAMINLRFEGMTSLQFQYRTSTNTPSVNQLQTSIDNTNPTQLSTGNPELKQTYAHSMTTRFGMPNPEMRTSFFVTLSYSSSRNAIATSVILAARDTVLPGGIELKQGTQISRPVNVDGSRNARGFVMYGFPVSFLGCQMNLNSGLTLGRTPGMINGQMNESRSTTYSQGLSLVSTFSSDVDVSLSYTGNYTSTKNTILSSYDNTYYMHTAGLRSTLTLWDVLVLRTDATNRYYNGLQNTFTQSYVMWNASMGMKLFANNQGELTLSVYDILKQNTNVSIATTELYTETQRTNALGQFILLTFTYTVRAF